MFGSNLHEARSIMVLKHTPLWCGILEKADPICSFVLFCLVLSEKSRREAASAQGGISSELLICAGTFPMRQRLSCSLMTSVELGLHSQ